jgi:predicted DNA binding protein
MTIAEIHVSHPRLPLGHTLGNASGVAIYREIQPVADADADAFLLFLTVEGALDGFEDLLAADPTVTDTHLVAEYANRRVYRVQLTDRSKLLTPILAELGINLIDVRHESDGWLLRLLLPDLNALVRFREHCREEGIDFRVKAMYQAEEAETRGGFGLTDAQRETLLLAFDRGYFRDPREITLQELSAEMGISSTALGRRLRRASERLIEATLKSPK